MYTTTVRSARITYTKLNRLLFEGKLPPSSQIVFDIGGINNSWAYCQKIKDGVKIKLAPNAADKTIPWMLVDLGDYRVMLPGTDDYFAMMKLEVVNG